jgi:Fe-S cluster assembly protein SufD
MSPINPTTTITDTGSQSQTDLHIKSNSHLDYFFIWTGQPKINRLYLHLDGENASVRLIGLLYLNNRHSVKVDTAVIHHAPYTRGETLIKGILNHHSQARLRGLIKIDPSAQHSQDLLTERFLTLSPQSRADFTPSLEIQAHQVKATHAATVSQLDPDQLYYLQTRGLPLPASQALLIRGFIQEVLNQFPKELQTTVKKTLPSLTHLPIPTNF